MEMRNELKIFLVVSEISVYSASGLEMDAPLLMFRIPTDSHI
jgi:hypothetical protein